MKKKSIEILCFVLRRIKRALKEAFLFGVEIGRKYHLRKWRNKRESEKQANNKPRIETENKMKDRKRKRKKCTRERENGERALKGCKNKNKCEKTLLSCRHQTF